KVTAGAGHFVVVTYGEGTPALSAAQPVVVAPTPVAVAAPVVGVAAASAPAATPLTDVIDRLAASAAPGAVRVGDFYDGIGDEGAWSPQLQPGKCYSFI